LIKRPFNRITYRALLQFVRESLGGLQVLDHLIPACPFGQQSGVLWEEMVAHEAQSLAEADRHIADAHQLIRQQKRIISSLSRQGKQPHARARCCESLRGYGRAGLFS
jgi:hypothetical protein